MSATISTNTRQSITRCGRASSAKGPDSEPFIDLDTMLDLTAARRSGRRALRRRRSVLVACRTPDIDSTDDDLKQLADKLAAHNLVAGSLVAPVWPPTGGGSAMGSEQERKRFLTQVRKACAIGKKLRDLGIRRYGVVRIDSAASPADWAKDPAGNTKRIAETFREACIDRRRLRRAARRRRRNLLGRHARLEAHGRTAGNGGPAQDARLSGGHGAHHALHAGL